VQDADAYEAVVRDWAALAAMPMADWDTNRMNALVDRMQLLQLGLRDSEEGRTVIEELAVDTLPCRESRCERGEPGDDHGDRRDPDEEGLTGHAAAIP
jgi:hypothetical protein